jgi:hypothetical protein
VALLALTACDGSLGNGTTERLTAAAQGGNSDANLSVEVDRVMNCKACFDVTADKNITHIFVKVDGTDAYTILVDGTPVDPKDLHDTGGPCNHGPDEIFREFLFPLTGNQKEAEICVVLNNPPVYANVTVGAKAASACADESTRVRCKAHMDHPGDGCPKMPPPWPPKTPKGSSDWLR